MALLAVLGERRLHQGDFRLFLGIVLGAAVVIVAVFAATGRGEAAASAAEPVPRVDP